MKETAAVSAKMTVDDLPAHSLSAAQEKHEPRPWWRGALMWTLVVAGAFGAGWVLAGKASSRQEKERLPTESVNANADAVSVTVEPVTMRSIQHVVEGMGTLYGFEEVTISARVDGRIRKVCLDFGDLGKPGDCFVEIDPTDLVLSLNQAERALQVELAKLGLASVPTKDIDLRILPTVVQAKARLDNMRSKKDRAEALLKAKAISDEDLSNIRTDLGVAEAEFENQVLQAKSGLAMIYLKQAALAIARQQVEDTRVRMPTPLLAAPNCETGSCYVVTHRSVAEGTLVKPGTEIGRLVINQTLKLRIPVPERHGGEIHLGQQVAVTTAATAKAVTGTVARIGPAVEPTTRTFDVEIQIPNRSGELKPGSFAKAAIKTQVNAQGTTVPLTALIRFAGIDKIFLAENGRAKEVQVKLGMQTPEWIEITHPALQPGAQVITSGQTVLAAETPVTVQSGKASGAAKETP